MTEMTYEKAMEELEKTVEKLERQDVTLDETISLYKRGAELIKFCEAQLSQAEAQIKIIKIGEDNELADFTEGAEA